MTIEELFEYFPESFLAIRRYYIDKGQTFGKRYPIHWLRSVYELKRKGKLIKTTKIHSELEEDDWEAIE